MPIDACFGKFFINYLPAHKIFTWLFLPLLQEISCFINYLQAHKMLCDVVCENQYNRGRINTIQVVVVKWLTAWPNEALTWVRVSVTPTHYNVVHDTHHSWVPCRYKAHTKRPPITFYNWGPQCFLRQFYKKVFGCHKLSTSTRNIYLAFPAFTLVTLYCCTNLVVS